MLARMARRKDTIVLKDPRALRALAHPARQRLITELFSGRVLTATEAAEMVGLSPSAVSHHLRALEKWGLARRAAATVDGRERPWEGTAKALNLEPSTGTASVEAISSIIATRLHEVQRQLDAYLAAGQDPWRSAFRGLTSGDLWLTEAETREVTETVRRMLERFEKNRSPQRHPKGARRSTYAWAFVPVEPVPGTD
jgi:DNA-binding transcriptional ArsR family regulator